MNRVTGLSGPEKRVLGVAFAGWALDALDFMSFTLIIPALLTALPITRSQAGSITSAALLTSALGGWLAGMLADRYGRVRVLRWVVMWFATLSLFGAFARNPLELGVLRCLQGFGFGGEWAVGAALVSEIVRPAKRGSVMGVVQSGWAIGWGLAVLLTSALFALLPAHLAWRAVLAAGFLPALLVVYIRRHMPESESFVRAQHLSGAKPGLGAIFAPGLRRGTALGCLMAVGLQGGYYAVQSWLPTYLVTVRGLSLQHTGLDVAVAIVGSFTGNLSHGVLSDRIGRRITFCFYALCAAATVLIYMTWPHENWQLTAMALPLGFFTSGVYGGVGAILAEVYPTLVRASGQGFTYNFGRGFGALFPALVGHLGSTVPLGIAIAVFSASAYLLAACAVAFMRPVALPVLDALAPKTESSR